MSTPSAAVRLASIACALALLALCGCGAGSGGGGERATAALAGDVTTAETQPVERTTATADATSGQGSPALSAQACRKRLSGLLDPLSRLRRKLAVGLSYDQYRQAVSRVRSAYTSIAIDRLPLSCMMSSGSEAERALNKYIDAVNAWGDCLADAGCDGSVVEPALQRKWRAASRSLSAANGEVDG